MMPLVSFFTRSTIIPINAWKSKQCETVSNYHFYHIKVKMSCRHGHWHFRGDLFINSNKFMQTVYYNFIFKILDLFGVFMQIGGDSAHKQKKLHLAQSVHLRPAHTYNSIHERCIDVATQLLPNIRFGVHSFYPWKIHHVVVGAVFFFCACQMVLDQRWSIIISHPNATLSINVGFFSPPHFNCSL